MPFLADFDFGLISKLIEFGWPGIVLGVMLLAMARLWTQNQDLHGSVAQCMRERVDDTKESTRLITTATVALDKVADFVKERGQQQDRYQDWGRERVGEMQRTLESLRNDIASCLQKLTAAEIEQHRRR